MNYLNDKQLIERITQGDQGGLEVLHARYNYRLFDFAVKILKDTLLAEEVVSDVFVNLWLGRKELSVRNPSVYLYTCTRNLAINALKAQKPFFEDIDEAAGKFLPDEETTDGLLHFEEFKAEIDKLVSIMPPQRQIVFRLNRFEGMRYKEIAEVLNISVNTVQHHMVEAVKFLARERPALTMRLDPFFS